MNAQSPSVLIMAGGTGGHVFPALAAAACLQEKNIHVEWLGTRQGIEARLVPEAGIPIHYLSVSGVRGKGFKDVAKALYQLTGSIWQSIRLVRELKPICVLGMGGFASGPGGVAARLCAIPLVIHEQNAVAGTTNKLLAVVATRVLQGYPINLGGHKARHIGNPVREDIAAIEHPEQRLKNRSGKMRLLVLGGSLGAKPINDLLPQAIAALDESERPDVWHQAGAKHADVVTHAYEQTAVVAKVEPFINDMAKSYAWADLVLCRAGALTVAELTAAGVASILVPLPHAIDDHQSANAQWLVDAKAGLMMPQGEMSVESLSHLLKKLMSNRECLLEMSLAAKNLAKVDAAQLVAASCLEVACG